MNRRTWLGVLAVSSLLMTGCAVSAPGLAGVRSSESGSPQGPDQQGGDPHGSHTMPDGTEMPGSEHGSHGSEEQSTLRPSEAAGMICDGQVVTAVASILGIEGDLTPSSSWDKPMFTCTYDVDGEELVLSVHDATDVTEGEQHFAALQESFRDAEELEGMAGLGLPSFSTGDGIVAFLRDGKTLLVDATAMPDGLGPNGTRTQGQVAYSLASAVLVCWVEHD